MSITTDFAAAERSGIGLFEGAPAVGNATGPVVGVRTTRIYCRPVCRPGRAPRVENCIPFPSATAAREAGFRACKQCRPDDPAPAIETVRYSIGATSLAPAFVAATERGMCVLFFLDAPDPAPGLARLRELFPEGILEEEAAALAPLFDHAEEAIQTGQWPDDVALDLRGTPFQQRVWQALREIPTGTTVTYGELTRRLGLPPGAARAVGAACGANPIALVVPCHRVVRAGGRLGGYRWGLDRKRELLDRERGRSESMQDFALGGMLTSS